jgi:DNA invertase Pin-like site-specific DNA recombinase
VPEKRPGVSALLGRLQPKDKLVVFSFDRQLRDYNALQFLLERLNDMSVSVVFVSAEHV